MAKSIPKHKIIAMLFYLAVAGIFISGCATKDKSASEKTTTETKAESSASLGESGKITSLESEILPGQLNIVLKSDKAIHYSAYRLMEPERLVVELSNTVPGDYKEPVIVNQGIVRKITPLFFQESQVTRFEITLDTPTEYNILRPEENILTVEIKNISEDISSAVEEVAPETTVSTSAADIQAARDPEPAMQTEEEDFTLDADKPKEYTGQKISLDFQNADVKNILRILAEISGLNIITSPEVTGTVSLRLINVPWDQAMDIVLKNNNLGMERKGNIIWVATQAQVTAEKTKRLEARRALVEEKNAKRQAEPLITEIVRINYANIGELKTNLDGIKSDRGKITLDQRTFTMILVDVEEKIREMKKLIQTLDLQTEQVSIEARIVEISRSYSKELGIRWGGSADVSTSEKFPNSVGITGGGAATASGVGNYVVDLPAAVGQGAGGSIGFSLGHIIATDLLDIQLSALESSGKAKVISNPRITTKDNVTATIESGKDIPFETVSQDGTATEWRAATIKLKTTPHITPDGYVSMQIDAAKDEPDTSLTSASGVPTITTRNMQTEVLVKDGETAVLGGLFKKNEGTTRGGVPWLSKIPGIGLLFKNRSELDTEEELLIFITPRILKRNIAEGTPKEKIN